MNFSQEQYIQFVIAQEKYAIHISEIHEIIKMQHINEVPSTRPYVKGVINLRGQIIPVVSLRVLFNLGDDEYTRHTRVVVVNHHEETIGIIVDRVDQVTTFTDIQPPLERIAGINGANFTGIGIQGDDIVGILKLDQVLIKEDESSEQP